MEIMSASPLAKTASAISGVLILLLVMTGKETASRSFRVAQLKAAGGTTVATVGMRASCHPMPVLKIDTPAFSKARANSMTSSNRLPFATKSSNEILKMIKPSGPKACRTF
jgi:hypothetical protein